MTYIGQPHQSKHQRPAIPSRHLLKAQSRALVTGGRVSPHLRPVIAFVFVAVFFVGRFGFIAGRQRGSVRAAALAAGQTVPHLEYPLLYYTGR